MPRPFPKELRDEVVAVARNREPGVTIAQVARDFGVSAATLTNWLSRADGATAKPTIDDAERRADKKRIKQLEQENEILRRAAAYFSQAVLPK